MTSSYWPPDSTCIAAEDAHSLAGIEQMVTLIRRDADWPAFALRPRRSTRPFARRGARAGTPGQVGRHRRRTCAITDAGVTAETDGPPGAGLFLARALLAIGIDVALITDSPALPLLEFGCDFFNIGRDRLLEISSGSACPRLLHAQRCGRTAHQSLGSPTSSARRAKACERT